MKNKIELWHIVGVILAIAILSQYSGQLFGVTFNLPQFPEYTGEVEEQEEPSQDVIFNLPDFSNFFPVWNATAAEGGEPKAQPTGIPNEVFAGILFVLGIIAVLRVKRYI